MFIFDKKIIALGLMLTSSVAWAQSTNVPLFADDEDIFDEEDHYFQEPTPKKQATNQQKQIALKQEKTPSQQQTPQKEVSSSAPNLGRNAIPLDSLRLTPNPLPDISIDLTNKKETEQVVEPKKEPTPVYITNQTPNVVNPNTEKIAKHLIQPQDVRGFELDHFYLGMTPAEIRQIALENGYKITKSKKELPLFLTTRYEQECRLEGFYLPADIRACIREKGLTDKTVFLKDMTLVRGKNESLYFEFTSPATGNQAWRITYLNKGDNSLNFNQVNTVKKLNRRDAFISAVLDKFGNPDDAKNYIWGDKDDAFMQIAVYGTAYDARITLTDMALSDEDYFEAKEWLAENPSPENFHI